MSCTGFDGYLYYNTASVASPTWVLVDTVRDVNTTASTDKADVSDRRSKFKKSCPAMIDLETTVSATYVQGNTALDAIRVQFLARTVVQYAIMDGPLAPASGDTSEGFKYYAAVYSNDFNQPLSDGQSVSFTLAPAEPTTDPEEPTWYSVTTA
jgi:hypothetical protein